MCVIQARNKQWKEVIKQADEALTVDDKYVKAIYHKGRALLELTEYQNAIDVLQLALDLEPSNTEVKKELARAQDGLKKYQDKEAKMFKKMFSGE